MYKNNNMDKLKLIQQNSYSEIYNRDDYLKANENRHYLNEIIINNQNELLRNHENKINDIKHNINNIYKIIFIVFIINFSFSFYFYLFKK
jgi:hypothetical protein